MESFLLARFGQTVHLRNAENTEALGMKAKAAKSEIEGAQLQIKLYRLCTVKLTFVTGEDGIYLSVQQLL